MPKPVAIPDKQVKGPKIEVHELPDIKDSTTTAIHRRHHNSPRLLEFLIKHRQADTDNNVEATHSVVEKVRKEGSSLN